MLIKIVVLAWQSSIEYCSGGYRVLHFDITSTPTSTHCGLFSLDILVKRHSLNLAHPPSNSVEIETIKTQPKAIYNQQRFSNRATWTLSASD